MTGLDASPPGGDFTLFGFTRDPRFVNDRISARLGLFPHIIKIGSLGQFFYHTSYGDVAESEEAVVLKLGFLRSTTKSALSASQLLEQKLVGPRSIDFDAISGIGAVVGLSKTDPIFSVFQTLLALPQFYYSELDDGIIFSDVLRCILSVIPGCEVNDAILPHHFIFQNVCSPYTYFRDVSRLMPGCYLKWKDGDADGKLVRSLDAVTDEAEFIKDDVRALNLLAESLDGVVGDYIAQIDDKGAGFVNQLSGGVDSTLTQFFMKINSGQRQLRSISYVIRVPSFDYELEYVRQAIERLQSDHTYVSYEPGDYPGLLTGVIDILAQPPTHETQPSLLAIVNYVREANWPERYFFTGHGSDSIFGFAESSKLKSLELIRKIPFASTGLRGLGTVLAPVTASSQTLLKGAEIIDSRNDPDALVSRPNSILTYEVDWDIIRRCFGDQTLRETLAYRRNLTNQYSNSCHYIDKVHFIELLTFTYDLAVKNQQIAHAYGKEQVFPFFDEDLLKVALTFHPDMRYLKGFRHKHLVRRLLEQKVNAPVARKKKGNSTVFSDFVAWMRSGPLKPMIEDMQRPDFMSRSDFESMIRTSNYFLLSLLTYDIFQKRLNYKWNFRPA